MESGPRKTPYEATPTEKLKELILSPDDYVRQPFARERGDRRKTYTYDLTNGTKTLSFFGTYHTYSPDAPVFDEIEAAMDHTSPEIVYVEGMGAINDRKDEMREYIETLSLDEVKARGENVYTLALAMKRGIEFESPEPPYDREIQELRDAGFDASDILAHEIYRYIPQYHYGAGPHTLEAFREHLAPVVARLERMDALAISDFAHEVERICSRIDLDDIEHYRRFIDPMPWPNRPYGVMNRISAATTSFRDRHIFDRLAAGLKTHDRAFVVYGSGHAVSLEPALRALMAEDLPQSGNR